MGILKDIVLLPSELGDFTRELGSKTRNLAKLKKVGYKVPSFLAIPAGICKKILKGGNVDEKLLATVAESIAEKLPASSYAVRSSALIEDTSDSSLAGQFRTELGVKGEGLGQAIETVLRHASAYFSGDLGQFSILIQEYIVPDHAGVLFTRNPLGGRERVIEFHQGRGEELVSGKVKPKRIVFDAHHFPRAKDLSGLEKQEEKINGFEALFGFAQDVEWCEKGGVWHYLQSRPITTISPMEYAQSQYLDEVLPKEGDFLYEKSEISEIAPSPTPFTWSLLERIYAAQGPVAKIYAKYGIVYKSTDFLVRVGNELFVDRERELAMLLPSYSTFGRAELKPHFSSLRGLGTTLKNIVALNRMPLPDEDLFRKIEAKLSEGSGVKDAFSKLVQNFMGDYELVFEINLLAGKAIKGLEQAIAREKISASELLGAKLAFVQEGEEIALKSVEHFKGNALEITDEGVFAMTTAKKVKSLAVDQWWQAIPTWKKPYFEKIIAKAIRFSKLREYGRWLTVKNVSALRDCILKEAKCLGFRDARCVYFASINELEKGSAQEGECTQRKQLHKNLSKYSFPSRLTNRPMEKLTLLQGVSAGTAKGRLVVVDSGMDIGGGILYTKTLTPDLTRHFGKIVGIVSEEGGLLSHLAIMARENHIPVVVGFVLGEKGINIGDEIEIDGGIGSVAGIT